MGAISLKYKSKSGNLTAPGDVDPGAMIPLATTTLSTSQSTITFSSIPQDYEHLQLRIFARSTFSGGVRNITLRFNSDTGSNYLTHQIQGNGSAVSAYYEPASNLMYIGMTSAAGNTANVFAVNVMDILDYTNTNKNTTVRNLQGFDENGGGTIWFRSGLWLNTSAINAISLTIEGGHSFAQYSHFALYGIKRAGA
jgi:hypothetical protein